VENRIGNSTLDPGDLIDKLRQSAAKARTEAPRLEHPLLADNIMAEVVGAYTERAALWQQLEIAEHALSAAQSTLNLVLARRELGV
jgi:outer membrane protein TolC